MPTNPLGSGVTRYLDAKDRSYNNVVFQAGRPPLDSELNLISGIGSQARVDEIRAKVASGWLMDLSDPMKSYRTHPLYSNQFYFGNDVGPEGISYAVVNGWVVPVTGTWTGQPPASPNDSEYWNRIVLNPPTAGTSGQVEFVFLEVWEAIIETGLSGLNRPSVGNVYKYGNVQGGFSVLPDQMIDPDLNFETTKRTQIQYRIRSVVGVDLTAYPDGFSPAVTAIGPLAAPSVSAFMNMGSVTGDVGLWRAGNGSNTLGTVDGYVYAIPLCAVSRRNSSGWSKSNMMGGFNRNSISTTQSFTSGRQFTPAVLSAGISKSDTSMTIVYDVNKYYELLSLSGINNLNIYIKVDQEIIKIVSGLSNVANTFVYTIERGQFNTTKTAHSANAVVRIFSTRPDGLYADQVAKTDILDLRHAVSDRFDYDSLLKGNLTNLLRNSLSTSMKEFAGSFGPSYLCCDEIVTGGGSSGAHNALDSFDGNRKVWSDSVVMQRYTVSVRPPSGDQWPVAVALNVSPYNIDAQVTSTDSSRSTMGTRTYNNAKAWFNGDVITIYKTSFSDYAGSDDVKFVLPSVYNVDAVTARFEGMTSDPNGGSPNDMTIQSATNLDFSVTGHKILKHPSNGIITSFDEDGNLTITLSSGADGSLLQEWLDSYNNFAGSGTPALVDGILLHIDFTVAYGSGRGLSKKPTYMHSARVTPVANSTYLLRSGVDSSKVLLPTYLGESPLVQTGNDRQYARTSEFMVDTGSKTVYLAPYQLLKLSPLLVRSGNKCNWYLGSQPGTITYQGLMPQNGLDGSGSDPQNTSALYGVVDPLDLFNDGKITSRFVEIPMNYLPKPGLHHIPIVSRDVNNVQDSVINTFPSGLSFLFMSKPGTPTYDFPHNSSVVAYPPTGESGFYIVTPMNGSEVYGTQTVNSNSPSSVYGQKVTIDRLNNSQGKPFKGIRFPPYYAPARITGVYLRTSSTSYKPTVSAYNTNREEQTDTSMNLLKTDFHGPTVFLDVNTNGDVTFVLNSECVNVSESAWDTSHFFVECTLFGFDRGFMQTNGRVLTTKAVVTNNVFVTEPKIGLITPAPFSSADSLSLFYTRTPYQGDLYNRFDDTQKVGSLKINQSKDLYDGLKSRKLPSSPLSGYSVLASTKFMTTLGTGRLSSSRPLPLLNQERQAPENPPDIAGTLSDLNRLYSLNRVGYMDWCKRDPTNISGEIYRYPVLKYSVDSLPEIAADALSERYDDDIESEFLGATTQLPLGSFFRDKDFVGKTMYGTRSVDDLASMSMGTLAFVNDNLSTLRSNRVKSTFEGEDFEVGGSFSVTGTGTESIVLSGATTDVTASNYYRVTRGNAGFAVGSSMSGGAITGKFPKYRPNSEVGSVLCGTAYLVKNNSESGVGGNLLSAGNELQMIIVTQAFPSYFRESDMVHCANGAGEGYTAIERYRISGRPIENKTVKVPLNIFPAYSVRFENKIYDDPLVFGSSDITLVTTKSESHICAGPDDIAYMLTVRPIDPMTVQVYLNGIKLVVDMDYLISGVDGRDFTYTNTSIPLKVGDVFSFWYVAY